MTNTNGFSDSQESALFGEEVYSELVREIGCYDLPLLTEDVMDEIDETMELKYSDNLTQMYHHEAKRIREEEQDQYLETGYYQDNRVPIRDEFAGDYNFQLLPINQNAKHLLYSQTLRKVFINMEETLPLRFKWDPPIDGLYLRTTMVFSLEQYRNDPVKRCHNHMALTNKNNQDIDPITIKHVVRCLDRFSVYEETSEHLSVVTPLRTPQPGSHYVPLSFQFLCKNSCPSGMNRRPTELIFTLEDKTKKVLGRRRLLVRVCSCPKRDKEKEEAEAMKPVMGMHSIKKRKLSAPPGTKMMPSCDTHVFNLQLNVVGKENYLAVLKFAYDIMAGQAARTGQFDFFKPFMDDILRKTP